MSPPSLPLEHLYQGRVLNVAHRGARMEAPENTILAFERAAEIGADGIELDVQLTADGIPVVFHDFDLSKTSNGQGMLREQPLAALRELDAGSHFSVQYAGTSIPTLDEVFECAGQRLLINVELKHFGGEQRGIEALAEAVIGSIRRYGMAQRVILSSFNPLMLRRVRQVACELALGHLVAPKMPGVVRYHWLSRLIIGPHQAWHPHTSMVDEQYVARAHRRGYRVNVWTVNEPNDIHQMAEIGADMIMSDYPDRVRDVLDALA